MGRRIFNNFILFFLLSFIFPPSALAGSASISLSGGTVIAGEQVNVSIVLNGIDDGNLVSLGGYLNYDSAYLELVQCSSSSRFTFNSNGNKIAFVDMTGSGMKSGTLGTCTFRTKQVGNTTVGMSGVEGTNDSANLSVGISGAGINIKNPPSGNNNLASLIVSPGSINFSPGNTNYNVSVDSNITSVDVSGKVEDPTASVSGLGRKNLNYGNNPIYVTVTAENGSSKTYTINVNRKDDRSTNNNLASLKVGNGTLDPGFSKGNTSYNMEVPFDVAKLELSAEAEDSKAKVSINNPDLVAEEVTAVTITVTAENGSSKTYTINVKRGKDPNKQLSNNNYLESLSVDVGILSPVFDKEKTKYAVYLPFEVTRISISAEVEDKKYATIEKVCNEELSVGNNLFKFKVTAEDGSTRTYTVTVVRNKSLDDVERNDNTYLKKLELKNGKLVGKFNKKTRVYHYKKSNKKFDIKKAEPEIKSNKVTTHKLDNAIVIIVETESGEKGFYVLIEEKSSSLIFVIIIIIIILIIGGIFLFKNKQKIKDFLNNRKKVKETSNKEKK